MNPGIDFFHLPSYSSAWSVPGSRIARRVCPELELSMIPGLAWSLKEAAWKSLPDAEQTQRFHPSQFQILSWQNQVARLECSSSHREIQVHGLATHQGFLSFHVPFGYGIFSSRPTIQMSLSNGRPLLSLFQKTYPISISHDGPYVFSVCPLELPDGSTESPNRFHYF